MDWAPARGARSAGMHPVLVADELDPSAGGAGLGDGKQRLDAITVGTSEGCPRVAKPVGRDALRSVAIDDDKGEQLLDAGPSRRRAYL